MFILSFSSSILDEKCRELGSVIEEQRGIIQTLKNEYASLIGDFQKFLATNTT